MAWWLGSFSRSGGMSQKGEYEGVVLGGIDPVKIGEGFGIEGRQVEEESSLSQALDQGLELALQLPVPSTSHL